MTRRSPHEGSVSYVAARRRWIAQLTLPSGKRKTVGYAATEPKARALLEAAKRNVADLTVEASKLTVGQYLTTWLAQQHGQLAASWLVRVESMIRLHLLPALGHVRLSELSPAHLARCYADRRRILAPQTVHHLHAILHRALGQAVRWGYVARNVADLVDAPRVERKPPRVLSEEEVTRLLAAIQFDPLKPLWLLALATGLREGELLALRWSDVDLELGSVMVRRNVQRVWRQGMVTGNTKSGRPHVALIPAIAVAALRKWREQHNDAAADALIFPSRRGTPLEVSNLRRRYWLPLLQRAGIDGLKVHELRHGAATLLLRLGVHPRVVAEMLGHADPSVTMRVYSHVLPTLTKDAVGDYGRLLERLSHAESHAAPALPEAATPDS